MKTLKLLLLALVVFATLAGTCEPEAIERPTDCQCSIEGTKEISTDGGNTWSYAGTDERTGLLYPCSYDETYTNQVTNSEGIMYRIFWECKE